MVGRRLQTRAKPEWRLDGATPSDEPGFRAIVTPGPQAAPGDETYLGNELVVEGLAETISVAALAGGGHVVAYRYADNHTVVVKFFDANGTAVTMRTFPGSGNEEPHVAGLADGGAVLVVEISDFTEKNIYAQRFEADGDLVGPTLFQVNTAETAVVDHPRVTALTGGGFVVTWCNLKSNGASDPPLAQLYDAAGAPVGGNFPLNTSAARNHLFPVIDALPDGGFVTAWTARDGTSGPYTIRAQRFDAAGNKVGGEIAVATAPVVDVDVAALEDGGIVVGWAVNNATADPGGAGGNVYARRYGPDGAPLPEGQIHVASTATGRIGTSAGSDVTVTGLDSNYFAITWVDTRPAVSTVFGRAYNAVGQSPSGFFIANQNVTDELYLSDGGLATRTDGSIVVAYEGQSDGNDFLSVFTRRIGIEVPDAILGTANGETLNGTALSDLMRGLGGNDVMNGGVGPDWMEGGQGDDQYVVDNAGDAARELAGQGNDRVYAGVSHVLGAGQSVETLSTDFNGGTTAINLTGNELANTVIGNAGVNVLNGLAGSDVLDGKEGNDTLYGGGDNDTLYGRDGNDLLYGGTGVNYLVGGLGDDQYVIDSGSDYIEEAAGQGSDRIYANVSYALAKAASVESLSTGNNAGTAAINLTGNDVANAILGNAGANVLNGLGGNDLLDGKEGNDSLYGGTDNDTLYGREGNDLLYGGTGTNYLAGGAGDDQYVIENGSDYIEELAGQGNDRVYAGLSFALALGASVETMSTSDNAGTAAINLTGNELANTIIGNAGANVLNGAAGNDYLDGKEGHDVLYGGANDDSLYGGAGNDTLYGGTGTNYLSGGQGDDRFIVDGAGDMVAETAGQGADRIFASVSYTLAAGVSVETLSTGDNAGTAGINLTGNELANTVVGNEGANVLNGGAGSDFLDGKGGADTYAFTTALGAGNVDTIAGFVTGLDRIALDDAVFTGLAIGALPAGAFVIGTAAADANDRIVYNNATGALLFDADGAGGAAAVQFASLQGAPALMASDFIIV
ncbi:MAG TPA: calcium-binding protein [Allosphingosinicella sp.]|nr:calcium-binding protein [Allosphingosinicella sp.]